MRARKPLWIIEEHHRVIIKGNALMAIKRGGFHCVYVGTVKGWILDLRRLPDFLAYLEHQHVPYSLTRRGEVG